jgi:hypothetical protein
MPTISYKIKYRKNEGSVFSPSELLNLFIYAIPTAAKDGTDLPLDAVRFQIQAAQKEIEDYLQIKFNNYLQDETCGYYAQDYYGKFPYFQTKYPVKKVWSLIGMLGAAEQIVYPILWCKSSRDSDGNFSKQFTLVPTGYGTGVQGNADVILSGVMRDIGLRSFGQINDYWSFQMTTGYDYSNAPSVLTNIVGKLATIGVLTILGNMLNGMGVTSSSLSIDGLSQSISTPRSSQSHLFSAVTTQYTKEVVETLKRVKLKYSGFNIVSL